jgi:ribosomal protein L7Ae-like RNA K-turn-binding protein
MNKAKLLSTLGLVQKAASVTSGEDMVLMAIRGHRARLVFLASDAGPSTTKRITDKSTFYNVPLLTPLTGDELSHAIGKSGRKVLAITDAKLAALLINTANELQKEV